MNPNKARLRDPDRARHMLDAANLVLEFTSERTFRDLLTDKLFQSAVERQLEVLGEAASHVSSATQGLWPSIPWRDIKNFRNLLAHEYFRTDYTEVWNVARHLLPALLPTLEELFADLDQQFGPDQTH